MSVQIYPIINVPYWLNYTFNGRMFVYSNRFTLSGGASRYTQWKRDDSQVIHIVSRNHSYRGGSGLLVQMYEGATMDDGVDNVPVFNLDRRPPVKLATVTIKNNPTNVNEGAGVLIDELVIQGQGVGGQAVGGAEAQQFERILSDDDEETYLIKYTNLSNQEQTVFTRVVWYETDN